MRIEAGVRKHCGCIHGYGCRAQVRLFVFVLVFVLVSNRRGLAAQAIIILPQTRLHDPILFFYYTQTRNMPRHCNWEDVFESERIKIDPSGEQASNTVTGLQIKAGTIDTGTVDIETSQSVS